MKKMFLLPLVATAFYLAGCSDNEEQKPKQFPKPGTVVAEASMPIAEDALNHSVFSVKVIADSQVAAGVYDVDADFGNNYAGSKFTMPKGAEDATPFLRKGTAPYTYIIGFKVQGDTTFYEYFEVHSDRSTTKMQYIKAYTF